VIVVGAIAVIMVLIFGIRYLAYATTHETTDDARVDADTVTITSKIAERVDQILTDTNQTVRKGQLIILLDNIDERNAVAQAAAALEAQVEQARAAQQNVDLTRTQVSAQTTQGTGGVRAAQSGVASAQAQTQSAEQQAQAARSAVAQAAAQLRVAQSQVPAQRAALDRANADLSRYASLVRTGDIAVQQLDAQRAAQAEAESQYRSALDNVTAAETGVVQAQARYTAALATTSAAVAGIGAQQGQLTTAEGKLAEADTPARVATTQAQADAASAQANSLRAQLKTAQDRLGYTRVTSPIDGIVGEKDVEIGTSVASGQALMSIVPLRGTYITANYKETQLRDVRVGQTVDISVDAYKGIKFHGRVSAIAPASQNTFSLVPASNATGNFVKVTQRIPVRIVVENPPPDRPLRVGMSVETSIKVK
jgi:membrane fusion protein (multidrug efflux system)